MIYVLTGGNDFALRRTLDELTTSSGVEVERYDGVELSLEKLADICVGATLFAAKRCAVISALSENTEVWLGAISVFERASDDTSLVLVEPKLDKRTKTYKWLQKNAKVIDHKPWGDRDTAQAVGWVQEEAKRQGVKLLPADAKFLVQWAGVNQQVLYQAIEKLQLVKKADEAIIKAIIDPAVDTNVFSLLEMALRGDAVSVQAEIHELERSDDAYRVMGLLASQIQQLVALVLSEKPPQAVAADIGAPVFVLSRLRPHIARAGRGEVLQMLNWAADADRLLKTVDNHPWMIVEKLLLKIAGLKISS